MQVKSMAGYSNKIQQRFEAYNHRALFGCPVFDGFGGSRQDREEVCCRGKRTGRKGRGWEVQKSPCSLVSTLCFSLLLAPCLFFIVPVSPFRKQSKSPSRTSLVREIQQIRRVSFGHSKLATLQSICEIFGFSLKQNYINIYIYIYIIQHGSWGA